MPRDPERRKLWTNAINRKGWTAKDHHRVCSRHFIQGKPSRNPLHPDHIPSLHMGGKEGEKSVGRGKGKLARFERTVERRQKESASFQVDLPPEDHRGYVDFSLVNERPKEWKRDHHVSFEPVDACVQTVVGFAHAADRLAQLEEENARLREKMEETSSTRTFGLHLICDSDRKTKFYTGLPTYVVFEALSTYLESEAATMTYWHGQDTPVSDAPRLARRKLTQKMELFAVLCRLRLGLAEEDIAGRCGVHASTFSRIFRTWIRLMAVMLPNLFPWPSRETIDRYAPPSFSSYPKTLVIIDCTEFYSERPTSVNAQVYTYASYKTANTFNALIGVSPQGLVTYVSNLWGGRATDRAITDNCGILDLIEPGDDVMADRGFGIEDLLAAKKATLNIPPFRQEGCSQLSAREVEETRKLAKVRIHVKRAIGRAKNFQITNEVIPITLVPITDDLVRVCFYLVNFDKPIVSD